MEAIGHASGSFHNMTRNHMQPMKDRPARVQCRAGRCAESSQFDWRLHATDEQQRPADAPGSEAPGSLMENNLSLFAVRKTQTS